MKDSAPIFERQKFNTRFKNADMDFMFNWFVGVSQIVGLAPSQVFYAVHAIRDGDPQGWCNGFNTLAHAEARRGEVLASNTENIAAGQALLGAAFAYRAALQYTSPRRQEYAENAAAMEQNFQRGCALLGVPLRPVEVPFENSFLPGYYLEHDTSSRPLVLMIGGSDTFREDGFYFAGYPGWKRGYNVLMVDLPGQGLLPGCGLPFRVDMAAPIRAILDWQSANSAVPAPHVAVYGVSGGGYFTALAAASEPRIQAWVAATPIYDIGVIFERECGGALQSPGWALNGVLQIARRLNESAAINLDKYAWQFGTADFKSALQQVQIQARLADFGAIACPSLFLVSEGEPPELKRQAHLIYDDLRRRGVDVTLREFTAAEGADGHCQVNNLRLAHQVVFDWLDHQFDHHTDDIRLIM